MLRLAELEEENEATTNGMQGTKAAADASGAATNGNGDPLDEDLEDGEVDEDEDLNLASNRDAGGQVGKTGSAGALLPSTKSTAAEGDGATENASKTTAGKKHAIVENTDATGPGKAAVLSIKEFQFCTLLRSLALY